MDEGGRETLAPAKPKVVVIIGATGAGKSRLAIDLAQVFPAEIINADAMQVYEGLDIITNKVPINDRKGVPHHLLGTIPPNVEFTAKKFRDVAIPIIDDILSRNLLPIIVGGTNYYIQALLCPFLIDGSAVEEICEIEDGVSFGSLQQEFSAGSADDDAPFSSYDILKELDPLAANRIHPNDERKISNYLRLYYGSGIPPSNIFQGKASENWGRAWNLRYDCCFICIDASFPTLDRYINERVDQMMRDGLLEEVYDVYSPKADCTRGLLQAIGVREFQDFLKIFLSKYTFSTSSDEGDKFLKHKLMAIAEVCESDIKVFLVEAVERMKLNTRRLVRRQKRRLNRLVTYFGLNLHNIDATEAFFAVDQEYIWSEKVVEPCVSIVMPFLHNQAGVEVIITLDQADPNRQPIERDLWTQYVCEFCGNRTLRGAHEWEQHKKGRSHRKRVASLKKKAVCRPL